MLESEIDAVVAAPVGQHQRALVLDMDHRAGIPARRAIQPLRPTVASATKGEASSMRRYSGVRKGVTLRSDVWPGSP